MSPPKTHKKIRVRRRSKHKFKIIFEGAKLGRPFGVRNTSRTSQYVPGWHSLCRRTSANASASKRGAQRGTQRIYPFLCCVSFMRYLWRFLFCFGFVCLHVRIGSWDHPLLSITFHRHSCIIRSSKHHQHWLQDFLIAPLDHFLLFFFPEDWDLCYRSAMKSISIYCLPLLW